jgi:hypothetical protein
LLSIIIEFEFHNRDRQSAVRIPYDGLTGAFELSPGLVKISVIFAFLFFLLRHQIRPHIMAETEVTMTIIKKITKATGDELKLHTNREHRKDAQIEAKAIANSKNKSEMLLLDRVSMSSFVTS